MDRLLDVDAFLASKRMLGRQLYTGPIRLSCEIELLKGVENAA